MSRLAATSLTLLLPVFRDSIIPLPAQAGPSGVPEVPSGTPSPPQSPPLAAFLSKARRGGAAFTITEQCERLFCEPMRSIFLGERNSDTYSSLEMGLHEYNKSIGHGISYSSDSTGLSTSESSLDSFTERHGLVTEWLEVWDYVGGARFRGFVAENEGERALFVFFDQGVLGSDLKPGLMALLELCSISEFDCNRLMVCLDRHSTPDEMKGLMRDLGWVGFEPFTLDDWTNSDDITSDRWVFLGMDV